MVLSDVPLYMCEMLATFEAFRRLNFVPSEIFAAFDTGELPVMAVIRNEKSFGVQIAAPKEARVRSEVERWYEVAGWWNDEKGASEEDRRAIWRGSAVYQNLFGLIRMLHSAKMVSDAELDAFAMNGLQQLLEPTQ